MTISSLKELQKLIALCRKTGVASIKVDGIEFNLGALPSVKTQSKPIDFSSDFPESSIKVPQFQGYVAPIVDEKIQTDELSEEQLLFYSSAGRVES